MKNIDQISANFTYSEFEDSEKAIELGLDNTIPNDNIRSAIRLLVINVLQPLRDAYGKPLVLNSGYRTPELNKAVKGSKNSQHTKGEAADIRAEDPLLLLQLLQKHIIPFDQVILYDDFIHISYTSTRKQRYQILYDDSYKQNYPKD